MATTPKKKKRTKPSRSNSQRYIEPIGSPILRNDIRKESSSLYDDPAARARLVASPGWKAYCNKAFFVFRLMQHNAAALASNQQNFQYPAFIWKYNGKFEIVLCPIIKGCSEEMVTAPEGCLSLPEGEFLDVERHNSIILGGYDHFGEALEDRLLIGWDARIVQHEYDHLLGKLIVDYLDDDTKHDMLESIRDRRGGI